MNNRISRVPNKPPLATTATGFISYVDQQSESVAMRKNHADSVFTYSSEGKAET